MALNTGEASQEPKIALDEAASRRALDVIRRDALNGLLALPRVGMGVGGFLAGVRRASQLQVLERIEIPCLHARGPGFLLTDEELQNARELAAKAEPLEVLGMYISKTRGPVEPGPADLETFEGMCPGEGQILLIIRPSTVEPVRATLFMREPDGRMNSRFDVLMDRGEHSGMDIEPTPAPAPNLAVQSLKRTVSASEQTNVAEPKIPDETTTRAAQSVHQLVSAKIERPAALNPTLPIPAGLPRAAKEPEPGSSVPPPRREPMLFQQHGERENPRRAVLYTCGAVALIAAAAFAALDMLAPRPELTLNINEENGATVFRWNSNAAAGVDRGRLMVNDAGRLQEFALDAPRIQAGFFQYRRKSDQILAKLVLGERSARAVFFGNSPKPRGSDPASRP